MIYQQHSAVVEKMECLVLVEAAAALASSSFFFSSPAAEMVLEMTVAVAAEVMAVTASGLSWFSFAAVVDAAMEMTAVVAVDANSNHSLSFQNDAGTYEMRSVTISPI